MSNIRELTDNYIKKMGEVLDLAKQYTEYATNIPYRDEVGYPNFENEDQMNQFHIDVQKSCKEIEKYVNEYSDVRRFIQEGELNCDPYKIGRELNDLVKNFWRLLLYGCFRVFDNDHGYRKFDGLLTELSSISSMMLDTLFE